MKSIFNSITAIVLFLAITCIGCSADNANNTKTSNSNMTVQKDSTNAATDGRTKVIFSTSMGDFTVELYNETPKHRDNFLKLVKDSFYNQVLFHRVIRNFMVQTGDPDSKNAAPDAMLGAGGPGYNIEAEINNFRNQLRKSNIENINNKHYEYQAGIYYMDMISECERLGDYVINVVDAIKQQEVRHA